MKWWIVVAAVVAVVVVEALRRCIAGCSGSVARVVGVWHVAGSADCVRFDEERVGYREKDGTTETFAYTLVGNRLTIESNCRRTHYRCTFRPDGTLLLTSGKERLTLTR